MLAFKDLIHFVAVYETTSFTGAAKRLGTVQSAVSDRIQRLERDVGAALFVRYHRSIRPTQEGTLLFEHAVRVLAQVSAMEIAVTDAKLRRSPNFGPSAGST